ncbi:conserved membrane hypothetical protein [Gammaproteobacteria bacterium]
MSDNPAIPDATLSPSHPLGLPPGSIRAIVALTVVWVFVWLTWHDRPVGLLLSEAMLIILAHYFASRQLLMVPTRLQPYLEDHHLITQEANPLWLPRHTIRFIILAVLFLTGVMLLARGELFQSNGFDNIFLIFVYLLGVVVNHIRGRRGIRPLSRWLRLWIHLKALLVVLACFIILLAALANGLEDPPEGLDHILLGWILFYFGSR